jgi:hypothetical protein
MWTMAFISLSWHDHGFALHSLHPYRLHQPQPPHFYFCLSNKREIIGTTPHTSIWIWIAALNGMKNEFRPYPSVLWLILLRNSLDSDTSSSILGLGSLKEWDSLNCHLGLPIAGGVSSISMQLADSIW